MALGGVMPWEVGTLSRHRTWVATRHFLFTATDSCTMFTLPSPSSNQPWDKRLRKSNFRCRGDRCGKKKIRSLKVFLAAPQLPQFLRLLRAPQLPACLRYRVRSRLRRAQPRASARESELKLR